MKPGGKRNLELDKWKILKGWLREGIDEALSEEEFGVIARTFSSVLDFMVNLDNLLKEAKEVKGQ